MEPKGEIDKPHPKEDDNTSVIVLNEEDLRELLPVLRPTLADISKDALGNDLPEGNLEEALEDINSMLLLVSEEGVVGFSAFRAFQVEELGLILDQPISMVRKKYQGKGHGTEMTRIAAARNPDAKYLTFATQNPAVVASVEKAVSPVFIAPLDKPYRGEDPEIIFDLMRVTKAMQIRVDPSNGLNEGIYERRFGDYKIDLGNPRIAEIEDKFQSAGLDRDRGDGMFMMARLPGPQFVAKP